MPASAQTLTYSYDAMGNRVAREIVLSRRAPSKADSTTYLTETIGKRTIRIFPNPTKGKVKVEIAGTIEPDACKFMLYSASGQLISSVRAQSSTSFLDLTSQPNGIYLLHILIGNEVSTYKLIKK